MIAAHQNVKLTNLVRYCAICGKELTVTIYPDKAYAGGHFFGKIEIRKKKKAEYWECNHCCNN